VLVAALFLCFTKPATAQERRILNGHAPAVAQHLVPQGRLAETQPMRLAIGVPLRDPHGLSQFLQQLYDPKSPGYRHYLTPEQFTEAYGPTPADYEAVAGFAEANGLTVVQRHSNRLLLDVEGPVSAVEKAFQVTMHSYRHPTEKRTFYAVGQAPSVPAKLAILEINGLDNYSRPHPKFAKRAGKGPTAGSPRSGSGPNGNYMGLDFRAAYLPGVALTGAGQTVGLLQFDGYFAGDIAAYEAQAGLPSVTLTNVLLDGYNGTPTGTDGTGEVSLDIEMLVSMAPGLSKIILYEAGPTGTPADILNKMATDDAALQLSSSWGWGGGPSATIDQIFQEMDAQGQTFFDASGDSDAYTAGEMDDPFNSDSPSDNPYITVVGGTTLSTSGPAGAWVSETAWQWGNTGINGFAGTSGGTSTNYTMPAWQSGISMASNNGSTTFRNIPDVALTADNVWIIYNNMQTEGVGGTSCAAPLWAGFAALVNQQAANTHLPPVGFLNPAIYNIALHTNYNSAFRDVTTGNNTNAVSPNQFFAVPGYDLCTGLGTPTPALINLLSPPDALIITPPAGMSSVGDPHGPFSQTSQVYTLTNGGGGELNWVAVNTNAWLDLSLLSGSLVAGGSSATVTASFNTATTNLPPGSYVGPVWFTDLTDSVVQELDFRVTILGAPVVQIPPASAIVRIGQPATFSVTAIGAPTLNYFWQSNGAPITGANLTSYTFPNPQLSDSGTQFGCVVSNTYGVVTSMVAVLTVSPSLVLNGGFETGDFTDWAESGNLAFTSVTADTDFVHSGNYGVALGPSGSLGFISQTMPTLAGSNYAISLWFQNLDGGTNEFQVIWDGNVLYDGIEQAAFGWTNLTLTGNSSGTNTVLQIGFRNDPSYYALDDIWVQLAGPSPPRITSQPTNYYAPPGGTAAFSVGVSGSGPLVYEWYFDGAAIPDATNATLTVTNLGPPQIGSYFVVASNSLGTAQSVVAWLEFAPTNLLGNGGFETGDFRDWTLAGDPTVNFVANYTGYVHTGNFSAILGQFGYLAYLSQAVPTSPGQLYLLSLWLTNPQGGFGFDEFRVQWNNNVLFDATDILTSSFVNLRFLVTGSGSVGIVSFGARNDPVAYGLDDVSLVPVPSPDFQSGAFNGTNFLLTWATSPGLKYQIQFSPSLAPGSWTDLGAPFTAYGYSYAQIDPALATNRFYRIVLVPPANAVSLTYKTPP
jgi:hypothetical protein